MYCVNVHNTYLREEKIRTFIINVDIDDFYLNQMNPYIWG